MSGGFRLIHGGRSDEVPPGLLIVGAAEIATLAGGVRSGPDQGDVGRLRADPAAGPDAADAPVVACWDGRIVAVGPRAAVEAVVEADGLPLARFARVDAHGGSVTPGLVDPHTHLLFGGSREGELVLRQQGAAYLDILAAGGGILSTVAATRAATTDDLLAHGRRWLDEMLGHGVTTVEAKSGYGLDLETEIRLVDAAFRLGAEGPVDVVPDVPRRARGRRRSSARGRTAPRPTSARSSRTSSPASRPMAARASATCSARTASSARTSRAGS